MTENAHTTAPLTRREARAIERRTGRRVTTGSIPAVRLDLAPAPAAFTAPLTVHDTAEIERNPDTGLVSVLPTEVIERVADVVEVDEPEVADALAGTAFARSDSARSTSVRAARPAALVARARRNTAASLGIAASAAVLATAAIAVPGGLGGQTDQASGASLASLVRADEASDNVGQAEGGAGAVDAASQDLVAAPATAPDRANFEVTSFEPAEVDEVVAVEETESAGDSTDGAGGGSAEGTGGGSSDGAGYQGGGGYDTSTIAGIAQSMMGGGAGWACTDFTAAVYAQAGITLPGGGVSAQAAGGTQTSDPQVGDLVIFYSGHVGIYAGGGMMWDNPGFNSSYVGWQNVYRSIDVIGSGYYFVTYR